MASLTMLSIFGACLLGCGLTSWHLGTQFGIETTVQHFIDEGILEIVEED